MKFFLMFTLITNLIFAGPWLTPNLKENIKYPGNIPYKSYAVIRAGSAVVRTKASNRGTPFVRLKRHSKVRVLAKVRGSKGGLNNTRSWYQIQLSDGRRGYIHASTAYKRELRYREMMNEINRLDNFVVGSLNSGKKIKRISAYKPTVGPSPVREVDAYGARGEQSARANMSGGGFRWLQDSRIVAVGGDGSLKIPDSNKTYKVSPGNLSSYPSINSSIKKVIVLDKKNQNQGVFQKRGNHWELVSYSYIATGRDDGGAYYDTPNGFFLVNNTVQQVIFYFILLLLCINQYTTSNGKQIHVVLVHNIEHYKWKQSTKYNKIVPKTMA